MVEAQWKQLIEERNVWIAHNFPDGPVEETMVGVIEELGELAHHDLKESQDIRGTRDEHDIEAMDAVGDLTVYLLGVMNHFDVMPVPLKSLVHKPRDRNQALMILAGAVGSICVSWNVSSKKDAEYHISRIVMLCEQYCHLRGWDYDNIVITTWNKVSKRDWKADPEHGGEGAIAGIPEAD
jgi:hypothetical protein